MVQRFFKKRARPFPKGTKSKVIYLYRNGGRFECEQINDWDAPDVLVFWNVNGAGSGCLAAARFCFSAQ